MTEYMDKPPYIAPEEPSGPCDWLESCWLPSTDWRRDPETRGFVPVCYQHSIVSALTRYREALEAQGSVGRHGWHAILCHGYTGKDCTAECVTARRALAGTGETPPPTAKWVQDYRRGDDW